MAYPEPIPVLRGKEAEEFLKSIESFSLTPEQREFWREAAERHKARAPITMTEYQQQTGATAIYPDDGILGVLYTALGLTNEAGEVAGKIKKAIRDDECEITPAKVDELQAELGDVLWYVSQLCTELGLSLGEVAKYNLKKLHSRQERGKLGGSGDDR